MIGYFFAIRKNSKFSFKMQVFLDLGLSFCFAGSREGEN